MDRVYQNDFKYDLAPQFLEIYPKHIDKKKYPSFLEEKQMVNLMRLKKQILD